MMTKTLLHAAAAVAASALTVGGVAVASTAAGATSYPSCGDHALAVTTTPSDSGMGHSARVLLFRNKTAHTCTLHGYPGLDALSASGHVLAHAQRTPGGYLGGGRLRTVVVRPGHYAAAAVEWLNFNPTTSGDCRYAHSIAVTPANTADTVDLPTSVSVCELQVHPTVGGAPGYRNFAAAQLQWQRGAHADSADQGAYWSRARADLLHNGDEWSGEAHELAQLIALPDSGLTRAQQRRYMHDVKGLNAFFVTPGLYL